MQPTTVMASEWNHGFHGALAPAPRFRLRASASMRRCLPVTGTTVTPGPPAADPVVIKLDPERSRLGGISAAFENIYPASGESAMRRCPLGGSGRTAVRLKKLIPCQLRVTNPDNNTTFMAPK
jgi:hypothetical protein